MSNIVVPTEWKNCNEQVLSSSIMIIVENKEDMARSVYLTVQKDYKLSIPGGLIDCIGPANKKLHSANRCTITSNFSNSDNHKRETPWQAAKREFYEETEMDDIDFQTLVRLKQEIKFDIPSAHGQTACRMYVWIVPDTPRVLSILGDRAMSEENKESIYVGLFDLDTLIRNIRAKTTIGFRVCGVNYSSMLRYSQRQNFINLLLACPICTLHNPLDGNRCKLCGSLL